MNNGTDIKTLIEELKMADPKTDSQIICKKMADSFQERRKLPLENVLLDFPRFVDTPGLVGYIHVYDVQN